MKKILIRGKGALDAAAEELAELFGDHRVVAFYGPMGAGKTTLIRHICQHMGVKQTVNSPTFAIVNEYAIEGANRVINHFDFYRIKSTEEAYDFGYQEYFFSDDYCFIEWPELVEELLPEDCLRVRIEVLNPNDRQIEILD